MRVGRSRDRKTGRTGPVGRSGKRFERAVAERNYSSDLPTTPSPDHPINRSLDGPISRSADSQVIKLDELIPSDTRSIEGVVGRVVDLLEESGCIQDLGNVQLALHEALTNAILHGNHCDPEKYVRLCVAIQEGGGILIVVKDSGSGFDPNKLQDPTLGENIYRESGRGVYLIQQLMDEVEYKFEGGTALIMRHHPSKSRP